MNIWPFKHTKEPVKPTPEELEAEAETKAYWDRIKTEERIVFHRLPVGASFYYLGTEMRVIRHKEAFFFGTMFGPLSQNSGLVCDYLAKDGIHEKEFNGQAFTALSKADFPLQIYPNNPNP